MQNDEVQVLTKKEYRELAFLLLIILPAVWLEVKIDGIVVDEPSLEMLPIIFGIDKMRNKRSR